MRSEQEQAALRLREQARRADKLGRAVAGRFVAGEERALAVHEARECGVCVSFSGGWDDAERVQVCFHPSEEEPMFTAVWVEASWNARFGQPEHRALLGSLMALGMERSCFGDLVAQEGRAYVYALPEVAPRLPMEWHEAGKTTLSVRVLDEAPMLSLPEGQMVKDIVASLRLDSVLASGMSISRSRAAEIIRAGAVMVNHTPEERVDKALAAGDLLSVRGFGRVRLREVGAPTRKDRLPIALEVWGGR